ncbi:type VII secretion integral membrane protein EccD [Gordonia sinesedis]
MASNFVRLTVIADDDQLDVSLPAYRPIAEYIDDILELFGPAKVAPATSWTLSTPRLGTLDLEDTLAEHSLLDGAELYLTKAPQAAPPPFVDDVLGEMRRHVSERHQRWVGPARQTWIAGAAAAALLVGGALVVARPDRATVVVALAAMAVVAVALGAFTRRHALGYLAWVGVPLVAAAAWRAGESFGLAESVAFAAAGGAAVGSLAAAIRPRSASLTMTSALCAIVFGVAGIACAAGANPTALSVWSAPLPVLVIIFAPSVALSSSGLLAQVRLGEQMELASRADIDAALVRGRTVADVMVWTSSAAVFPIVATIALTGVWQQGIAAGFLLVIWLLRSRGFTHVRHVGPMVMTAAAGATVLCAGVIDWIGLSGASMVGAIGIASVIVAGCCAAYALPPLSEVAAARVRRFLDGIDLPLAVAFIPIVFFAQGVYSLVWPS